MATDARLAYDDADLVSSWPQRGAFALLLISALAAAPAQAQNATVDATRLRTASTPDGLLGTDSSVVLHPMQLTAGVYLNYAHNPVVWRYADGSYDPVLNRQLMLDIVAAMGIVRLVDVAFVLPVAVNQRGPQAAGLGQLSGAGFGDVRILPRISPIVERTYGFSVAFIPEITLPTGATDRFLGESGVSFRPRVVGSLPLNLPVGRLRAHAGLGYLVRKNAQIVEQQSQVDPFELSDEMHFNLGASLAIPDLPLPLTVMTEFDGATAARKPFSGDGLGALEWLAGARVRLPMDIVATLGFGVGLTQGVGIPMYRIIGGAAWSPLPKDTDKDGIPDSIDECPALPEDYDGFADLDGCPEADNDRDGIPDVDDQCPNVPEDINGEEDEDGCPETLGGDQDGDGLPDLEDACPLEPEDIDGFQDDDGCPDPDHDLDGVPDETDQCPTEKETINGIDDEDGCPDEGEGQTTYLEDQRIDINAQINFESGKATLKPDAKPILNQVALQILAHPEIPRIRVEGHTDSLGDEEDNLFLSQDRADSVRRYLVGKGVDRRKLEAVGYGEARPIDSNATRKGRATNRRVEFVILREQ